MNKQPITTSMFIFHNHFWQFGFARGKKILLTRQWKMMIMRWNFNHWCRIDHRWRSATWLRTAMGSFVIGSKLSFLFGQTFKTKSYVTVQWKFIKQFLHSYLMKPYRSSYWISKGRYKHVNHMRICVDGTANLCCAVCILFAVNQNLLVFCANTKGIGWAGCPVFTSGS